MDLETVLPECSSEHYGVGQAQGEAPGAIEVPGKEARAAPSLSRLRWIWWKTPIQVPNSASLNLRQA